MDSLPLVIPSTLIWPIEGQATSAGETTALDSDPATSGLEVIPVEGITNDGAADELGTPLVDVLALPDLMVIGSDR